MNGKPRPAVTWWRDYALLDDTYTFVTGDNSVRNELEIEELRRNDLLAVLQCQASNNNITVPASVSITLDVNRKLAFFYYMGRGFISRESPFVSVREHSKWLIFV
ncbi:UNVERIFIED_CONTAM: hypothetical protein NCL1_34944 [Trichonephila clavipes]